MSKAKSIKEYIEHMGMYTSVEFNINNTTHTIQKYDKGFRHFIKNSARNYTDIEDLMYFLKHDIVTEELDELINELPI